MSLDQVSIALRSFLGSQDPAAIALTGKWGRGKTYFWQAFMKGECLNLPDALQYSYVSLFGVTSLQEMRDGIFDGSISIKDLREDLAAQREGEQEPDARKGLGDRARDFAGGATLLAKRYASVLEKIPQLNTIAPIVRTVAFNSIRGYVICIDDIERRSSNLSIKDVLGLVSHLREQKGCRVLLILNSDALHTDAAEFDQLKEKVLDYEISFTPTATECVDIAIPATSDMLRFARARAIELQIRNIRILKRIHRVVATLESHFSGEAPETCHHIVHSAVLMVWCSSGSGDGAPSLDFVKSYNFSRFIKPDKLSETEIRWSAQLSSYGYNNTNDLDLAICHLAEFGFLDMHAIDSAVADKRAAIERDEIDSRFIGAWELFHAGFRSDETEIVAAFHRSFIQGSRRLSAHNAAAIIGMLRELGEIQLAESLTDHWIETQKQFNPRALDLSESSLFGEIKDAKFVEAVQNAQTSASVSAPTLREVVERITQRDSWSNDDESVLMNASEDDFYSLFKQLHGSETVAMVRTCLDFGGAVNAAEARKVVSRRAAIALRRIAAESTLNHQRIRTFGVLN